MLPRLALALLAAAVPALVAAEPLLEPFAAKGSVPAPPWHVVGLPRQSKPFTQFSVVDIDGVRGLRIEAIESYGNLVHPLRFGGSSAHLAWQWRIERPIETADLHSRGGDDTAVKVCVSFDLPIENISFGDRQVLRFARATSADPVPGATVCYVWDAHLAAGAMLDNAFTRRIRYVVVRGGTMPLHKWMSERRDLAADFNRLFGAEIDHMPPIVAIAVGADSDNTHTHSLAYVASLVLEP
ncbi:MAG: DUF3047 domain-containing protein [Caldimonas sp.]